MNYFEGILKYIKFDEKNRPYNIGCEYGILRHLIELMGEEHFNLSFKYCFIEDDRKFEVGFYMFHKSMRNTDFFEICEGHLDMIFWNFVHVSRIPERVLDGYVKELKITEIEKRSTVKKDKI